MPVHRIAYLTFCNKSLDFESIREPLWEPLGLISDTCLALLFECVFESIIRLQMEVPENDLFVIFWGLGPEAAQGGPKDPPRRPPRSNLVQKGAKTDAPNLIFFVSQWILSCLSCPFETQIGLRSEAVEANHKL